MSVLLVNAEAGRIPMEDGTVHCSVSSPPYYSLRAYQGDQARYWPEVSYSPMPGLAPLTIEAMSCPLGHEPTPEAFIGHLVACYREVYRVLREDGVCWVVIGDSYNSNASNQQGSNPNNEKGMPQNFIRPSRKGAFISQGRNNKAVDTLQQGDLMLIPHRLALALQADGWLVRNDCVFAKVAPMPESIQGTRWTRCRVKIDGGNRGREPQRIGTFPDRPQQDHNGKEFAPSAQWADCPGCPRCENTGGYVLRRGSWRHTRAHETVLHLTKGMGYWSDGEAVRENYAAIDHRTIKGLTDGMKYDGKGGDLSRNDLDKDWKGQPHSGRNPRSVLTPRPSSYPGAHYATYPPDLIRPLIKSSCPTRCCPSCGAGWAAVVEREVAGNPLPMSGKNGALYLDGTHGCEEARIWNQLGPNIERNISVLDYRPTCDCARKLAEAYTGDGPQIGAEWVRRLAESAEQLAPVPGIVLDPFVGSGTTLIVAREEGLNGIGLDLSYAYLHDQARVRLELDAWDAWHGNGNGTGTASLEGLPLFEGVG